MEKRLWSNCRTFLVASCFCLLLFLLLAMSYQINGFGAVGTNTSLHSVADGTNSCIQGGTTLNNPSPEQICIDNASK